MKYHSWHKIFLLHVLYCTVILDFTIVELYPQVIFLLSFTSVIMPSYLHLRLSVWLTWLQQSQGQYLEYQGIILGPEGCFVGKLPRLKTA